MVGAISLQSAFLFVFKPIFPILRLSYKSTKKPEIEQALRQKKANIGFVQSPSRKDLETFELLRDEYIVLLPPHAPWENKQLTWQELEPIH